MNPERPLSPRQAEIVNLAAAGHTDKEIARVTGLSLGTLRTYWDRLRHRYDARSRSEVIAKALLRPPVSEHAAYMLLKLPLYIWTVEPSGEVDYCNEWFSTAAGFDRADCHDACRRLMTPDEAKDDLRQWTTAQRTGTGYESLVHLPTSPDHGPSRHKLRLTPIRSEEGIIVKWLGYARELAEDADERMVKFLLSILH